MTVTLIKNLSTEIVSMILSNYCWRFVADIDISTASSSNYKHLTEELSNYQRVCSFWQAIIQQQVLSCCHHIEEPLLLEKLNLWARHGNIFGARAAMDLQIHTRPDLCDRFHYAMLSAAETNQSRVVNFFLQQGLDVGRTIWFDSAKHTVTSWAAASGRQKIVESLIHDHGASVNNVEANPLHAALKHQAPWRYLRSLGADVNMLNDSGTTPLMVAILRDDPKQCSILAYFGADVEACNSEGITCLMLAVMNDYVMVTETLLGCGANPNKGGLLAHAIDSCMGRMVSELLRYGAEMKTSEGWSAVRSVLERLRDPGRHAHDSRELTYPLQLFEADFDERYNGKPLLCWEVLYQQQGIQSNNVRLVAENVSDIDQTTNSGESALKLACAIEDVEIRRDVMHTLLEYGADPDLADHRGETPIMIAGLLAADIEQLLAYDANINSFNHHGQTALHLAVQREDTLQAKVLLSNDIDATVQDSSRHTARFYAEETDEVLNKAFQEWQLRQDLTWDMTTDKYGEA